MVYIIRESINPYMVNEIGRCETIEEGVEFIKANCHAAEGRELYVSLDPNHDAADIVILRNEMPLFTIEPEDMPTWESISKMQ